MNQPNNANAHRLSGFYLMYQPEACNGYKTELSKACTSSIINFKVVPQQKWFTVRCSTVQHFFDECCIGKNIICMFNSQKINLFKHVNRLQNTVLCLIAYRCVCSIVWKLLFFQRLRSPARHCHSSSSATGAYSFFEEWDGNLRVCSVMCAQTRHLLF